MPKQPQDHKQKAAKRLKAEAEKQQHGIARRITVAGRRGEVTVSVIEDTFEWGVDAAALYDEWGKRDPEEGGITSLELMRFLCAIVSPADADRVRAVEPTPSSLAVVADAILNPGENDEEPLGESQAS